MPRDAIKRIDCVMMNSGGMGADAQGWDPSVNEAGNGHTKHQPPTHTHRQFVCRGVVPRCGYRCGVRPRGLLASGRLRGSTPGSGREVRTGRGRFA